MFFLLLVIEASGQGTLHRNWSTMYMYMYICSCFFLIVHLTKYNVCTLLMCAYIHVQCTYLVPTKEIQGGKW